MSQEYQNYGVLNRQQKNPNPLLENKFTFTVLKLPETSWSCVRANIPGTSIDIAWQKTRFNQIPRSGIGVNYQPLSIEFMVDEDLNNYVELVNWMRMLAMPITSDGNSTLKLQSLEIGPERGLVSDINLVVLTNESVPNFAVVFRDAFPINLGEVRFTTNTNNPNEHICTAEFAYMYYDIEPVNTSGAEPN